MEIDTIYWITGIIAAIIAAWFFGWYFYKKSRKDAGFSLADLALSDRDYVVSHFDDIIFDTNDWTDLGFKPGTSAKVFQANRDSVKVTLVRSGSSQPIHFKDKGKFILLGNSIAYLKKDTLASDVGYFLMDPD